MLDAMADELHVVSDDIVVAAGSHEAILDGQLKLGLDKMHDAGHALRSAATSEQARAVVLPFLQNANAALSVLAMLPLPPQAAIIVRIASLLLPAIGGAAAVLWPVRPSAQASVGT